MNLNEEGLSAFEDYDKDADLFIKKIKSEIQYNVFSSKKNQ